MPTSWLECQVCKITCATDRMWITDFGMMCHPCFTHVYPKMVADRDDTDPKDGHKHEWKLYIGFTDRYRYCKICGAKSHKEV